MKAAPSYALCFLWQLVMCTISPLHWRDCGSSCDLTLLSSRGCKNVSGFPAQYGNQLRRWVSRWGLSKKVFFKFQSQKEQLYNTEASDRIFLQASEGWDSLCSLPNTTLLFYSLQSRKLSYSWIRSEACCFADPSAWFENLFASLWVSKLTEYSLLE